MKNLQLILSMLFLLSCGLTDKEKEKSDSRDYGDFKGFKLEVTSEVLDNGATAQSVLELYTKLSLQGFDKETVKDRLPEAKVIVSLLDSKGKVVYTESKPGGNFNWSVPTEAVGEYVVEIKVAYEGKDGLILPEVYKKNLSVDREAPVFGVSSSLDVNTKDGTRVASLKVSTQDKDQLKCDAAKVTEYANNKSSVFSADFIKEDDSTSLVAKGIDIPASHSGLLQADVICFDKAGNPTRSITIVSGEDFEFQMAAIPVLNTGTPIEGGDATYFTIPGDIKLKLSLIDGATGGKIADSLVSELKGSLKIYISEIQNADLVALEDDRGTLSYLWADEVDYSIRDGLIGQRDFYATLSKSVKVKNDNDEDEIVEKIVSIVPLKIYIDRSEAKLTWLSSAQFIPAAKDVEIPMSMKVEIGGAPINGSPKLEYSTDNQQWTSISLSNIDVADDKTTYSLKVKYPLADEKPFRIRVKVTDVAGNLATSIHSPNLVGVAGLNYTVTAQVRSECLANNGSGNPGSRIAPYLASSYLCKQTDSDGNETGLFGASLLIANHGSKAFFEKDAGKTLGMRIVVDGVNGEVSSINHVNFDEDSAVSEAAFLNIPISAAEFAGAKLTLEFDIEEGLITGTSINQYSTVKDSACYSYDGTRPKMDIKSSSVKLLNSNFSCYSP